MKIPFPIPISIPIPIPMKIIESIGSYWDPMKVPCKISTKVFADVSNK